MPRVTNGRRSTPMATPARTEGLAPPVNLNRSDWSLAEKLLPLGHFQLAATIFSSVEILYSRSGHEYLQKPDYPLPLAQCSGQCQGEKLQTVDEDEAAGTMEQGLDCFPSFDPKHKGFPFRTEGEQYDVKKKCKDIISGLVSETVVPTVFGNCYQGTL
jgi:hypothetical protein